MNWQDSPQEEAFRSEVQKFIRDEFPAAYEPDFRAEQSLEPEDVWGYNWPKDLASPDPARRQGARLWAQVLAKRGWIAPRFPVQYGGAGLSAVEEFILQEEMMRARVPTVNGIGAFLLGPTLLEHGTDLQKTTHLPRIARGEMTWAQGFSEPGSGSDLASLRTRAVKKDGEYRVTGQKIWTSLGQYADWLFILARTDLEAPKHRGITFLLVDAKTPGITIRPIEDLRGATPFTEIFFDQVRVPETNRVGDENRGWYVAMTALSFERAGIGACVKFEQGLRDLVAYLRSDQGLKYQNPSQREIVRREIAQRYTEIRVLYNLARYTVSRQLSGQVPGYEASVSQLFGAELHQRLAATGIKAFGPFSQIWQRENAPMGAFFTHLFMDSVAATFLGGSAEIQRNVIATRGLNLPRD